MMEAIVQLYQKFLSLYDIRILKVTFDIIKILVITFIGIKIGDMLISRFYKLHRKAKIQLPERKIGTLISLTKNILRYVIYFIAAASILKIFNIEMTSILAVAGIGSLAIGFGAQNLVKDVISGFFIIFEDQFSVGDYVTINGISGTVEEIGLRITKIRGFSDGLHIIPNGEIKMVSNLTKDSMMAVVNIGFPLEEDVDKIIDGLQQICDDIKNSRDDLIEGPSILGITDMQDSKLLITLYAKTQPMQKWAVERDIRYRVKKMFDEKNISFPYPRTNIILTNKN
ncbi:small conductance mechanosensitive channel [Thermoanaerobacter uzonensis DSM 18761]|uniref:Small conductance mechanosensitive channel n=1 Tax=Thermoanaerobacter uzonensis DSM 18761 TaxID=1123369 RepID=A0A1M4YCM1_9THEO|nr:mechanosensitive ion channel family protein [Thermoanaerobacter uzonensis]SHF03477.1 small conductance mechanosensitive channel [Thermoanaerobacter uzonensis DSM 18761]